ncbi:MAG: bifunctional [glutamine synthetase] adenylyltransferase/[glutamine synthetase]-adenylyl-L-tyrosine phosphorylase, partial [Alphaproteobacteria bacterium]
TTDAFAAELVRHLTRVQDYYDALFERLPQPGSEVEEGVFRGDDANPETLAALREMGFREPEKVLEAIATWRSGRYAATRSERARERLNQILQPLLEAFSSGEDPDAAVAAFDRFLAGLPAGVQLFSLLCANPGLLRLISDIMSTAPRLARVLGRRPRVLDAVLDPGFFGDLPAREELARRVAEQLEEAGDYQECLDRARAIGTEQGFLIGVRVISGTITAEQAGGAYAMLAETLIQALHGVVTRELERSHGTMPGGRAAVIAMGKLGGREMTAASDLDLIIVYDFDDAAPHSTGARPLAGGQYYARFTQRLISALTAPTAEGALYEVDMRLRPSGHAGPVATRLSGFRDYQHSRAWTWEHMALTRARVIAGPASLRKEIEATIHDVLCLQRDRRKTAEDVRDMRARIEKEKGSEDIWDLKQVRGGLIDLEFIAQFLQLVHAHDHPEVLEQNTAAALARLADAGVLAPEHAQLLLPAAKMYHDLTQLLRLCLDRPFHPQTASPALKNLLAQHLGESDFASLENRLKDTIIQVHKAFEALVR